MTKLLNWLEPEHMLIYSNKECLLETYAFIQGDLIFDLRKSKSHSG